MTSTVFIVTRGEYSDHRIERVFTKREFAEMYKTVSDSVRDNNRDPCEIEELEVDDGDMDGCVIKDVAGEAYAIMLKTPPARGVAALILHDLGLTPRPADGAVRLNDPPSQTKVALWDTEDYAITEYPPGHISVLSTVSPEHAFKVCVERVQRYRAEHK